MRRNALFAVLLVVVGLAIFRPSSWTRQILSKNGTQLDGGVLRANLGSSASPSVGAASSPDAKSATRRSQLAQNYGKLPLSFEPNAGQSAGDVRFLSRGQGYTLFLTGDQAVLRLKGKSTPAAHASLQKDAIHNGQLTPGQSQKQADAVLSMRLIGANPKVTTVGGDELPGIANYFIGSNPKQWRTHVPTYARVRYSNVYPGVDLVYYGNQSGQLEYDFVVAPGADPSAIALSMAPGIQGDSSNSKAVVLNSSEARALSLSPDGDVIVHLRDGNVRLHKPLVYQSADSSPGIQNNPTAKSGTGNSIANNRTLVDSHYVLTASNQVHFVLGSYDHSKPLCIDPILYYSTYMGGVVSDTGNSIAVDSNGNAYIAGATSSPSFPNATNSLNGPAQDAFVTELNPTGTAVVYYTYLGGTGVDTAFGVAVDALGNAYVTGLTYSGDFPTVNPLSGTVYNNPPAGYVGPAGPNTYAASYGTGFVAELPAGGASLIYSTYLGGSTASGGVAGATAVAGDVVRGIAIDPSCTSTTCVDLTGTTLSSDFPVTSTSNSFENYPLTGAQAAFVTKLSWNGSALTSSYSTLLGGISAGDIDAANAIAVDASGNIYVTGQSRSTDFPSVNGLPASDYGSSPAYIHSNGNAFVAELNPGSSSLVFSSLFGGSTGYGDAANGIAVDPNGNIYVAGLTYSEDFPHPDALPGTTPAGTNNTYADTVPCAGCAPNGTGFVAEIEPWANPSVLAYSSYLGGTSGAGDSAQAIAVDELGDAFIVGTTRSANFPTVQGLTYSNGTFLSNTTLPGASATFASEIVANGGSLLVSTYMGGSGSDSGNAVAIDANGDMFLTGSTSSTNFPTAAPFIPAPTNQQDVPYQGTLLSSGTQPNAFVAMIQASAYANIALSPAGAPDCSLNNLGTSSCNFTANAVGQPSGDSPEVITVVNTGNAPATFNSITITPGTAGSTDFALTPASNCPTGSTVLAPGAGCAVSVTFAPAAPVQNETATLQINYNNNAGGSTAGGPGVVQTVNLTGSTTISGVPTTTVVTSSAPPVFPAGTPVTFTATVTVPSTGSAAPGGTVNFVIDGNVVASGVPLSGGTATYSTSSLTSTGSPYTVVAIYSGGTFGGTTYNKSTGSLDPSVGGPVVTASTSPNPSAYGQTITISAHVTSSGSNVTSGSVTFYYPNTSGTNLGSTSTVSAGVFSITYSALPVGSDAIDAVYTPVSGTTGSGTTTQTVQTVPITATLTAANKTYDGTATETGTMSCSLTGVLAGDAGNVSCAATNGSFNTSQVATANQVTATVTISGSAASHYTLGAQGSSVTSTSATASANITPATATVVVTPYNVTYNGQPQTATVTSITGVNGETGATVGTVNVSSTTHTSAGTYSSDTWSFTPTSNYSNTLSGTSTSTTITDAISQATATVVVAPYNVTYDGTVHTATVTSITGVNGETGATVGSVNVSNTAHTSAGTYASDSWSFTGTANYNNIASTTITDTINKATATVVVTPYTVTYDGTAHTATITSITGVNGETGATVGSVNVSNTAHTSAGTYASDTWSFTGTANYNNIASTTITDTINKANATVVVNPYTVTYDGTAHTASGTATGVLGETLSGLSLTGTTHTAAGTYNGDPWTFTDSTGNYNNASGSVNDVISKANATINVTPYSVNYTGTAHTASGTATGVLGETLSGLNLTGTTHTAAGAYASDPWTFTDSTGNYNNASGTVSDSIAKANPTVNVTPYSVSYDGTVHTASGTATGVLGETLSGLNLSGTAHSNAGAYASDPWTFTDSTGNYNNTNGTVSDSITQALASVTPNAGTKVYGTSDPTLTGTLSGFLAGDGVTATYSRTPGQAVGNYTISATLSATGLLTNYNITYNTAQFSITAATLTVTASSGSFTYGGTPPTITPSYSGFVNGDGPGNLSIAPTCFTGATSSSTAGNYGSNCSGGSSINYIFNYVGGTVIVNAATPTVAAVGGTFVYNGNPEAASYTALGIDGHTPVVGSFNVVYSGVNPTNYGPTSVPPTAVGTYSVNVIFTSTDPDYTGGIASTTIIITPATPTVVVTSSANPSTVGSGVSFTATVSSLASTPTGSVQFVIDGANFGGPTSLSGGLATSPTTITLAPGEHVVTAVYSGDVDFAPATSPFLIQVVNNPLASIAVTPATPTIFVGGTQQFAATGTFTDASSAILPTGGTWTGETAMTNGVRAPMAANGGNGLLYYFGGQDSGGAENYTSTYNPATGAWGSSASMITARYQGVAVAPGNGLIYVIGGWNNSLPTNVVEAYNPATNSWTSEASMSHLSGCSVGGAINGLIYVLTGCDGNAGFSSEFDVYNPATNTWTSLASPAHTHNSGAGGVIGGKLYVAGGYDQASSSATGITEVYDPQLGTWTTENPMPAQLAELGGAVFNGNLYVVGGLDNTSTAQPDVYVFNAQSDTWSTLSTTLAAGRRDIGVAAFDGLLYAAGGYTSSTSNALEVLDTDDVTWASDTTSVATVDPNAGLATGASAGTANISASSETYSVSGSTLLTVNKQSQTITFANPGTQTYGAAPVAISASDSASLPVTFASSTGSVCTVSTGTLSGSTTPGTVTILTAGTCTIVASQAGNADYLAATSVSQTFTVSPAALSITASSTSKTYGQVATLSGFTTSGLLNTDTVTSVTLTSAGAAATAGVVGSPYSIVPSAAVGTGLSNYTISYVNGSLTVNTAPLSITASSTSKTYGQVATLSGFTTSGLLNTDTVTSVTLTSAGSAATAGVVGSPYSIVPSAAVGTGLSNYTISYVNGSLTVNTAPLSITASSTSKTYGQVATLSGFTTSGLLNADTVTSVTLTSAGSAATAGVVGSPYSIVPSAAVGTGLSNYTISYVNGSLTVNTAPLSITASSTSKTYGQVATLSGFTTSGLLNADTVTSVTLTSAGSAATAGVVGSPYSIVPSAAVGTGLSNYTISYVNGSLTVNTAPLSITASSTSKTYGQVATLSGFTTSGLLNTDTVTSVTLTSAGSAATAGVVGSPYSIVPSAAVGTGLSNYTISYVNGSLTVNTAPLSITASSTSKTYGQVATLSGFTTSGLLNADTVTSVTLTSAGSAATAGVVGSPYSIVPSAAVGTGLSNYTISYVNGSLTVNTAPLSITASSTSKTYGQVATLSGFTTSGLLNTDTVTSVTLTSAGAAATATVVGSPYSIVPSAAVGTGLSNYTISYVNGSLTVNTAPLSITASSTSKTYGQVATLSGFTTSGLLNTDTVTSVTLTSAGSAATAGVVGSPYSIVPSAAVGTGLSNYTISYVNGSLTVNRAALTVTANAQTKVYGAVDPSLTYSVTSGALVSGDSFTGALSRVAGSNVGSYAITQGTLTISDIGNYNLTYVGANLTITAAPLTITASSGSMTYGGTVPTITASYSGFVNGDSASSLTTAPTCSTTATSSSAVGPYTTSCSGAVDGNYTISYTAGSLTVSQATLTITASTGTMTYGGTVPTITPSYSGFVAGNTSASLTTQPTCSTTATTTSPVGSYTSTCTGAVDANYSISYVAGSVAVGKAPLVITASSGTMTFGGTPPTVTPSYSGFVAGNTAASLTTAPTCVTSATSATPAGTDTGADSCSGAVDANYTISYVAGNVVVSPAPLTITASNFSITAGSSLPTFTATYSGFVDGNTAANLTGTLACGTVAANTNTAGTYSITCSGLSSPNYTITYVAGTLTITGSVNTGTPIASVSPGCVSFGDVLVNTNCATNQPVTLTNIGTASLSIASIAITGSQAADFTETNTCGTSLAAGASCVITVAFKPSTVGPETATLLITDNSNNVTGSTQTVGLSGAGVSQIQCNFNGTSISSGNYVWFNSVFSPKNVPNTGSVTYSVSNAQVTFTSNGTSYSVPVPNSIITLSSSVTVATTTFDSTNNRWITLAPLTGLAGNIFLDGVAFPVPATGLPGGIQNVNWQASFATDTTGAGLNWQWAAAVYNNFTSNYNQLCVKPVDDTTHCQYQNSDHAGTCEGNNSSNQSWKGCVTGGATGGGGSNCTGSYSGTGSCTPPVGPLTVVNCATLGTTSVGTTTTPVPVTLTNNSSSTVTGITFTTTGPYAVSSTTCGSSLAAGATCIVYVTFTPTAAGTQTGTLKITDSASNSPQTVNLSGNLTSTVITNPGPIANVTPTCLNFTGLIQSDCQQYGTQPAAQQTVTVSNTGTTGSQLNITNVTITGNQSNDFSFVNNCPTSLAAGAQCTISVSFNPQTVGPEQAALVITDNSNDVVGSTQTVSLNGAGLTQLQSNFNENWIGGVNYVWFSGSIAPQNINSNATTNFFMTNGTVTFTENNQNYSVSVPDCIVTFSPNVQAATTSFDTVNNRWVTIAPTYGYNGNTFLAAVGYQVPGAGLPGSISNVTWTAAFATDTPGASLTWQWAAAPYSTLPTITDINNNQSCDYNSCNVKPVDGNQCNNWNDNENAGTPEGYQAYCYRGATCDGVSNHTGNYCNPGGPTCKLGPVYTNTCATAPPTTCGQTCPPVPVTVCNKGSQPLCITSVKCTGDFQVCNNVSGTTLQPGQSCTVNVSFCPSQKGTRCGTLQVTDNTTNSPHTVCLTGNGQ